MTESRSQAPAPSLAGYKARNCNENPAELRRFGSSHAEPSACPAANGDSSGQSHPDGSKSIDQLSRLTIEPYRSVRADSRCRERPDQASF